MFVTGLHVNDTYNVPDEQGRVLINIGHAENEEDIFLAPQIARVIKPHQVCVYCQLQKFLNYKMTKFNALKIIVILCNKTMYYSYLKFLIHWYLQIIYQLYSTGFIVKTLRIIEKKYKYNTLYINLLAVGRKY